VGCITGTRGALRRRPSAARTAGGVRRATEIDARTRRRDANQSTNLGSPAPSSRQHPRQTSWTTFAGGIGSGIQVPHRFTIGASSPPSSGQYGRTLHYIDLAAVVARLNEGCDAWDFTVEKYEVLEGEVVVLGRLVADSMTKSAFGGSTVTVDKSGAVVSIADDLKAAAGDALKKASSLLGVGLELYSGQGATEQRGNGNGHNRHDGGPPADAGDRATVRQLAAIHAPCRKRGYSKDGLARLVAEETGKVELSHLTRAEASGLIDSLNGGNGAAH